MMFPRILPSDADMVTPTDVFVSGTDVYVSGIDQTNPYTNPVLWKNGEKIVLPTERARGQAHAVFVDNKDVFVVGREMPDVAGTGILPIIWKNGVRVALRNDENLSFEVNDIFVANNNVYVVGSEFKNYKFHAVLWKNGERTNLTDQTKPSMAHSISVSGTDVYVAGVVDDKATLSKNGVASSLSVGITSLATKTALYVSGSDIYVASTSAEPTGNSAQYSKNNAAPVTLSVANNQSSSASSIFVSGTGVFVGGYIRESTSAYPQAVYWKNGEEVILMEDKTNIASSTTSIFITQN